MADKKLIGIKGWLLFFTITLYIESIVFVLGFLTFGLLVVPSDASPYNIVFLIGCGVLSFLFIKALTLEHKRSKRFPRFIKMAIIASLAFTIILTIMDRDPSGVASGCIYVAIWYSYLNISKRVKNTFVK